MNMRSPSPSVSAPSATFIGLAFSLSGWLLAGAGLLSVHAGLRAHLISTLMALYLVFCSTKRLKLAQQFLHERPGSPATQRSSSAAVQVAWALLPLMTGVLVGVLILGGSTVLLGLATCVFTFVPWSRVPICRDRIVVASVLMCIGMGLPMLVARHPISPIFLFICAWLLWLCATFAIFNRIGRLWQAERNLKAAARASAT